MMRGHDKEILMRCPRVLRFSIALAALGLCAPATAQRGKWTDFELGLSFKPPSRWSYLGRDGDRGRLRVLFASPRYYAPKLARGLPHTPTLRLLFFPKPQAGAADAAAESADGLPRKTPYRDLDDYLARVHGPGTEIQSREAAKHGKVEGTQVVARVPREEGELTLSCFRIDLPDGQAVLEFEVLSEQFKRLSKDFRKCLGSLVTVPRKKRTPPALPAATWLEDFAAWRKLPASERMKRRQEWGAAWRKWRESVPEPGFKKLKHPSLLVLSRADGKFNKRLREALGVLHDWIDQRFSAVSDDVVMPATVRVFADLRELFAYRMREDSYAPYEPERREIYFYADRRVGNTGEGFGMLGRGLLLWYLHDKDPHIVDNLPRWLDFGLTEYLRSTRIKGKKITFKSSDVENGRIRYHFQHDSLTPIWALIQETIQETPQDGSPEDPWGYTPECARLIRWLETGAGKTLGHEDFLVAYLQAVAARGAEAPPDPGADVDWRFLKDDQAKELRARVYARRDALVKKINDTACPLGVPAWEKANAAWKAFNEKFK